MRRYIRLILTLVALAAGGIAAGVGAHAAARWIWLAGVIGLGAPLVFGTLRGALRGVFASDVVASLSILGAAALNQPLAGLVIVLMQTGGEALERYAEGRASAAVRALEQAAPRVAHVVRGDAVVDVPATQVAVGDVLLIRPGDLIPCDGVVVDGDSDLDTSSLTGEAAPLTATRGVQVMSGMLNGVGSFHMRATALASDSQYAKIVELVRTAQSTKAPLQRLADRYAVWFTPATLFVCALAFWATRDWMRVLAILVVATPCPLILATPVAIIGGINRAAKRFIIIRHGGALEQLGQVTAAVFDKTGTLTVGKPHLQAIRIAPGFDRSRVLRCAASVEEHSSHLLARVLVDAVRAESPVLPASESHIETPGQGVAGVVEGHEVRVGARAFVVPFSEDGEMIATALEHPDATLRAYISIDRRLAAVVEYADQVRGDLAGVLHSLEAVGVTRVVLLSGDHAAIARSLAARVGIRETWGDLLPDDKAKFIQRLRADGYTVMMVGDGVNDAPALMTANVGVALAAHGGGITAESADVIVLVDSLDRVREAMTIGRRTMRIARQSIWVGLGLSGLAMIVAAFGGIRPVTGAMLQEVIDVAVILNALRTAMEPRGGVPPSRPAELGVTHAPSSPAAGSLRHVSAIRA